MDEIIEIRNLSKVIKGQKILDEIDLCLEKGKIYGFVGYNGSGKSMLFKSICGFIKPTCGEIFVFGKKIGDETDFPENVGIVIEQPGFIPDKSAFDNLRILAEINRRISNQQIKEAIAAVGLDPLSKKKVKAYSLGMKQRLAIAQAIMENPDILILDEPFNGLDKQGVELIRELLLAKKAQGKTILLCSHISEDIRILCDNVWEMDKGRIKKLS